MKKEYDWKKTALKAARSFLATFGAVGVGTAVLTEVDPRLAVLVSAGVAFFDALRNVIKNK